MTKINSSKDKHEKDTKKEQLVGIGGWLSFFIWTMWVTAAGYILASIFLIYSMSISNNKIGILSLLLVTMSAGLFATYTAYSLRKLRPNAISLSIMWLIWNIIFVSLPGAGLSGTTEYGYMMVNMLWIGYFWSSVRIKNTFPKEKRESKVIDKVIFSWMIAIIIFMMFGTMYQRELNSTNNEFIYECIYLSDIGNYNESLTYCNKALEYYDKQLETSPNEVRLLNGKSQVLIGLNRDEEALVYLNRFLTLEPNNAIALENKCTALKKLRIYDEACLLQ